MEKSRKLFIKQCTISRAWYSDKIGQQVPFVREDSEYYWSREDAGFLNIVAKQDADIIEEKEDSLTTFSQMYE